MDIEASMLGALGGGAVGVVGAFAGAAMQRAARIHRNDVLVDRGESPVKDVVWAPPWRAFGGFGAAVGALAGGLVAHAAAGAVAGAVLPMILLVTSAITALQVHRARPPLQP